MGGQTFKTNWNLCRQNLTTMFNCTADLLIPCNTTWVLPFPNIGSSATEEELRILVVGWFHCTRPALWGHHGWPAGLLSSQFPILSISKQCNQHNRCNGTLSFERLNIWTLFTVTSIWPSWPNPCCEVYWTTSLIMRHQWIRDSWFLRIYRRICMNFKWAPAILHLAPTVCATTPAGNNNLIEL